MKFDTNNHSVFILHYHLIMCVKYRRKVIDDEISKRLMEIFMRIAPDYNITLEEWNHDMDHIHVLLRGQPNTEMSKFINAYKSASSRLIKKEFPQIRKSLWKEMFWAQSYCLITAGGATVDIIRQYIQTQGDKNGKETSDTMPIEADVVAWMPLPVPYKTGQIVVPTREKAKKLADSLQKLSDANFSRFSDERLILDEAINMIRKGAD